MKISSRPTLNPDNFCILEKSGFALAQGMLVDMVMYLKKMKVSSVSQGGILLTVPQVTLTDAELVFFIEQLRTLELVLEESRFE